MSNHPLEAEPRRRSEQKPPNQGLGYLVDCALVDVAAAITALDNDGLVTNHANNLVYDAVKGTWSNALSQSTAELNDRRETGWLPTKPNEMHQLVAAQTLAIYAELRRQVLPLPARTPGRSVILTGYQRWQRLYRQEKYGSLSFVSLRTELSSLFRQIKSIEAVAWR